MSTSVSRSRSDEANGDDVSVRDRSAVRRGADVSPGGLRQVIGRAWPADGRDGLADAGPRACAGRLAADRALPDHEHPAAVGGLEVRDARHTPLADDDRDCRRDARRNGGHARQRRGMGQYRPRHRADHLCRAGPDRGTLFRARRLEALAWAVGRCSHGPRHGDDRRCS